MEEVSIFSKRLKEILDIRNMTQSDLSRKAGIPRSAISQYLSGKFSPKQNRLNIIAKALKVKPAWLLGYDEDKSIDDDGYKLWLELTKEEQLILIEFLKYLRRKTNKITRDDLRKRRKELGLTLEEVAKVCNVGKSTVRKWETGIIKNMGIDKVNLLAKALKIQPNEILELKDNI